MNKRRWLKHGFKWGVIPLSLIVLLFLLAGTTQYAVRHWDNHPDRGALALPQTDQLGDSFAQVKYLEQNWTPRQSLWFYSTSQGSDLLPYFIIKHLEQADSSEKFMAPEQMNHYRYLPQLPTYSNPDGLPVGMVKNTYKHKDYFGFTCAACHTSQVNVTATQGEFKNKTVGLRIDGGSGMADMEAFLIDLGTALKATQDNSNKRSRFVDAVLHDTGSDYANAAEVLADLQNAALSIQSYNAINLPLTKNGGLVHYGYARLDAFGRIYNRALEYVAQPPTAVAIEKPGTATPPALTTPFNPPNAPVSYPFLWDTPQHDYVQWNGLAANAAEGPIGRNAGEVIGVFGTLDWQLHDDSWLYRIVTGQPLHGKSVSYESSVDIENLKRLEGQLETLQSPQWPTVYLGPLDAAKALRGRQLYHRYCEACHALLDSRDKNRRVIANFTDINAVHTDPTMAENGVNDKGLSGILQNQYVGLTVGNIMLEKTAPVAAILTKATKGVVLTTPDSDKFFAWRWAQRLITLAFSYSENPVLSSSIKQGNYSPDTMAKPFASLLVYKARPLNGIWATAPYLHNGSVPNLYDLLLPKKQPGDPETGEYRPDSFVVGSRQLDPQMVGFKSTGYQGFQFDTQIPGNSNEGHEYGTGKDNLPPLTKDERWDLIEYLKSL